VLLQRARAEIELEKHFPATEGILLEAFKEYLRITPGIEDRDEIIHVIEQGHCRIEEEPFASAWRHITVTLENVLLISDLDLHVVRNYSGVPFLFGDAPVVFCNTYYQNVKSRGVLGLQTPGLQIFFPLDSWTLLLFLDQKVYSGPFANGPIIDLISKCDVSQLNALQLHHSLNAVYFADASAKGYVEELWRAHRPTVVPLRSPFRILTDALVDGKPADCVYHSFEPKINFRLSLSFIDCTPIAESDYKWARRSPELVEEQKRRDAREFGEEDNPDATDLDGHVSPGSDFYF
jgi:hypothetical protein